MDYKELVDRILDVVHKTNLKDMDVMKDMSISIEEGKKKFAENNELFRLEVNHILREALRNNTNTETTIEA